MKYLKLFNTKAEYNDFINKGVVFKPALYFIEETKELIANTFDEKSLSGGQNDAGETVIPLINNNDRIKIKA